MPTLQRARIDRRDRRPEHRHCVRRGRRRPRPARNRAPAAHDQGGWARGDQLLLDLPDQELCKALGVVEANGTVTGVRRAGLLLFGREGTRRRALPTHEVAFQVLAGTSVQQNDFFRWPLLRCFEELTTRFRARNRAVELVDLFRTEIPDYSEEGFREALANALIHRDWAQLGAVHVQWTDDGIRIDNPGGFPEGVRIDNLLVTPPRPRSPLLADAFKRAGIVERTGRGVDTIYMGQARYGRPPPRYDYSTEASVSVVLPGGPANHELVRLVANQGRAGKPLSLGELLVIQQAHAEGALVAEQVATYTQTSDADAHVVLARLVDGGFMEARGQGRGRSYHLSASLFRQLGKSSAYVHTRGFEPLQQEQMILQFVRSHGRITRKEAAELCKLTLRQAGLLLEKMKKNEQIRLNSHYVTA